MAEQPARTAAKQPIDSHATKRLTRTDSGRRALSVPLVNDRSGLSLRRGAPRSAARPAPAHQLQLFDLPANRGAHGLLQGERGTAEIPAARRAEVFLGRPLAALRPLPDLR